MRERIGLGLVDVSGKLLSGAIALSRGQSFTITGSGFGSAPTYWDFLDKSPIMQQAVGTNFGRVGRWSGTNFIGASNRPVIDSSGPDGQKCLFWNHLASGQLNSCLQFFYDSPVPLGTVLYFTRWVRHKCLQPTLLGGQWKSDRWQASTSSLSDKANEVYKNIYIISATDNKIQMRDDTGASGAGDKTLHAGTSAMTPINKDLWIRADVRITLPSAYANKHEYYHEEWIYYPDGSSVPEYYLYTDNQAVDQASPYSSDASRWNMHLMQNYFGSGTGGDLGAVDKELRYAKVSEIVGGDCRLEFGNTPNHVRSPISFSSPYDFWMDTEVGATFDPGTLNFGYMKVIRGETILKAVPVRVV